MKILLIRHGETIANKTQLVLGTSDVPLTDLGRRQAKAAAQKISSWSLFQIYYFQVLTIGRRKLQDTFLNSLI